MKKIYIASIALLVSGFCAIAQPVLEESDFSPNYSADVYTYKTSGDLFEDNYGEILNLSGLNQTWGFSGLPLSSDLPLSETPHGTSAVVPVSSALNSAFFPSVNYCVKSDYGDIYGNEDVVYRMYNISSTGIKLLGKTSALQAITCPEDYIYFPFPYEFGTELNGTHNCGEPIPYEFTTVYDSFGTLETPFGLYEDVIREKTVSNVVITYRWLQANPFSVIMEVNLLINGEAIVYVYNETTTLSVNEVKGTKVTVYPNPSSSVVNLRLSNQNIIDKVLITDLAGKIVLQSQNADQIDVQGLAGGMYILQVFSENEKYLTKFIKR